MSYDPGMRFGRCVASCITGAALVVVAHAVACGEFGVTGDTATDGAAPPADGPSGATGDASGVTSDAGAGADGEASTGDSGCGHLFCADFEGASAATGWDVAHVSAGASAVIASGLGMPGSALMSAIPAQAVSGTANDYAYVVKAFPGEQALRVELAMNVPSTNLPDPATVLTILQVSGAASANEAGVGVTLRSMSPHLGFFLADGSGSGSPVFATADLTRDKWTAVVLEVRFGAMAGVKLTVDNSVLYDQPANLPTPPKPELRVGVQHYNGPTPVFSALFDTVRVDRLP